MTHGSEKYTIDLNNECCSLSYIFGLLQQNGLQYMNSYFMKEYVEHLLKINYPYHYNLKEQFMYDEIMRIKFDKNDEEYLSYHYEKYGLRKLLFKKSFIHLCASLNHSKLIENIIHESNYEIKSKIMVESYCLLSYSHYRKFLKRLCNLVIEYDINFTKNQYIKLIKYCGEFNISIFFDLFKRQNKIIYNKEFYIRIFEYGTVEMLKYAMDITIKNIHTTVRKLKPVQKAFIEQNWDVFDHYMMIFDPIVDYNFIKPIISAGISDVRRIIDLIDKMDDSNDRCKIIYDVLNLIVNYILSEYNIEYVFDKIFLKFQFDINRYNSKKIPFLFYFINYISIDKLNQCGADYSIKDHNDNNILFYWNCITNDYDSVKFLFNYIDINHINYNGDSAIHRIISNNKHNILIKLIDDNIPFVKDSKYRKLLLRSDVNFEDFIRLIYDVDLSTFNDNNDSVLHECNEFLDINIIKYLIEDLGCDIRTNNQNKYFLDSILNRVYFRTHKSACEDKARYILSKMDISDKLREKYVIQINKLFKKN